MKEKYAYTKAMEMNHAAMVPATSLLVATTSLYWRVRYRAMYLSHAMSVT